MAKTKYGAVKTTLWGVFFVGKAYGGFRSLKAAFTEKKEAEAWAEKWSEENFYCTTMVEEIEVSLPPWDGKCDQTSNSYIQSGKYVQNESRCLFNMFLWQITISFIM